MEMICQLLCQRRLDSMCGRRYLKITHLSFFEAPGELEPGVFVLDLRCIGAGPTGGRTATV